MPTQKPDPRRSPTPYALSLRISTAQYRHLVIEADRQGVSMAAATRQILDAAIDGKPRVTDEDGDDFTSYRTLLSVLSDDALEQLADSLPRDGRGASDDQAGDGAAA